MFQKILKDFRAFRPSRRDLVDEILRLRSQNFDLANKLEEFQMLEKVLADKLKVWVDRHDAILLKYKALVDKK